MRRRRRQSPPVAGLVVAVDIFGHDIVWPFGVGSLLVAGSTGSGKSTAIRALLWGATPRPDVALVLVDLKRAELTPWAPRALALAVEHAPAIRALDAVRAEVDRRAEALAELGRVDWDTALGPWLLVVVDELAELLHGADRDQAKEVGRLLQSVARLGRAVGVHLICATQTPTADVIPTALRGQMVFTLGLRVRDHSTSDVITQGAAADLTSLGDVGPGWAHWLDSATFAWPPLCRPTHHDISEVAGHVARHVHLRECAT